MRFRRSDPPRFGFGGLDLKYAPVRVRGRAPVHRKRNACVLLGSQAVQYTIAQKGVIFLRSVGHLAPTGKLSRMNESLRGPSLEPRAPREAQQHARRVAPSPKNHTGACHRPDPARPSASRLAISQISNALFLLAPAPGAQISNARSSPAPRTELTPYALRVPARRLPRRVPRWTPPPPPPA